MSTGYLELVGLQVTFNNVSTEYNLVHYYRKTIIVRPAPVIVMRSYDMARVEKEAVILEGLRKVWAPVVLNIWNQDTVLSASEYLQLKGGSGPHDVGLEGDWVLVS